MNLTRLRERAERFSEDVARESYLAYSGHKSEAALQPSYDAYADVVDDAAFETCVESFHAAPDDSSEQRSARMLLDWQIESQVGKKLAPLDEREIAIEASSVLEIDGRQIQYQRAPIEIANAPDRAERIRIDDARAKVVRDSIAPLHLERLTRERDAVTSVGIAPSYNATFEVLSGISLSALAAECLAFLDDTREMWRDVLNERLRAASIAPDEALRADALALFRLREFDGAFPTSGMEHAARRTCADMGIDATADGRITYDLAERPGKRARAFCSPVRVPGEVYLVMRPHGGQSDYTTFMHELGHALHFAYARADYPFEYRWLGDNSVTEGYAMLFDHRMQDAGWLTRHSELGARSLPAYLRASGFEELHFIRRYCAKLVYEIEVYSGATSWASLPDLYVSTLTEATGFKYREEDAFIDLDPHFYSTRYLRAWQLQAVLNDTLTSRFNEDWWRNPAAGPWIAGELFGEGQRETASELATRVAGAGLSFAPLVKSIEMLLAG